MAYNGIIAISCSFALAESFENSFSCICRPQRRIHTITSNSKEHNSGVFNSRRDMPDVVEWMLPFSYVGDYSTTDTLSDTNEQT